MDIRVLAIDTVMEAANFLGPQPPPFEFVAVDAVSECAEGVDLILGLAPAPPSGRIALVPTAPRGLRSKQFVPLMHTSFVAQRGPDSTWHRECSVPMGSCAVNNEQKVHEMIADACLRARSPEAFESDLRAFLESFALDGDDVAAILDAPPRLALYRRLIRHNLGAATFETMPRTRARLNALAKGAFDASFDAFLDEAGPRSHYFRDVPAEFLAWATPRWKAQADLPRYVGDLAAHELVKFAVAAAPTLPLPEIAEVTPDRTLVFTEAHRLMRYDFAVHKLPAGLDDRTEPEARAAAVLVYRDAEHKVRFLELSPLAASVVVHLVGGDTLAAAIPSACAELHTPLTDSVRNRVAQLLSDLGERGVLLGARANR